MPIQGNEVLIGTQFLWVMLILKHLVCDFLYQPPYQWKNKGTYGHPGGIVHAGQHALATFLVLLLLPFILAPLFQGMVHWAYITLCLGTAVFEFLVHYHMDWFKMWWNARQGWRCDAHPEFWKLLGWDQFVHMLTYWFIVCFWGYQIQTVANLVK